MTALRARWAAAATTALLLVGPPRPAGAQSTTACANPAAADANPLAGGTSTSNPADFGNVPEVCPAGEASLRVRGELVDASDAPDFFGRIAGTVTLRARRRVTARTWFALSIDLLEARYVNDAGLAASGMSFGPASLGYHFTLIDRTRGAVALYARALLPIDTARGSGIETGLELGASARLVLPRSFVLDGGLALPGRLDLVAGQAHGRVSPAILAEAWWSRSQRLAVVAGVAATFELSPDPTFLLLAPRAGLRTALPHRLWLGFLAEAPLAGADRTNLMASVRLGWTPP